MFYIFIIFFLFISSNIVLNAFVVLSIVCFVIETPKALRVKISIAQKAYLYGENRQSFTKLNKLNISIGSVSNGKSYVSDPVSFFLWTCGGLNICCGICSSKTAVTSSFVIFTPSFNISWVSRVVDGKPHFKYPSLICSFLLC